MTDREKILKGLEIHTKPNSRCIGCPYPNNGLCGDQLYMDALKLLKEQETEIKALRLLVEWAEECDFGFDNFGEELSDYIDEAEGMDYIEGMIHVARRVIEESGE